MSNIKKQDTFEKHVPDWLDQQCDKVFKSLKGLSDNEQLIVIEQVQDYIQMSMAYEKRQIGSDND